MPTSTPTRAARTPAIVVLLAAAGFAAGLVVPPPPAAACSCVPPPPPAEAMAAADAVVRGTVVALLRSESGVSVTLRVRTVWKGPTGPRLSLMTGRDSAGCGYPFRFGTDMIVYGHAEAVGDFSHLSTSSCDRTGPYDAVEAAALGTPLAELPWVDPPGPNCPRCPIPSAAGALAGAEVAFHGLPLRIEDIGSPGEAARRVRFRVLGVWKGDVPAEVDVVAPYLAWACRGEHWLDDDAGALVFAQRTADGGLTVSICGRLDRYDPADAASLGPMTPSPTAAASPAPSSTSASTTTSTPASTSTMGPTPTATVATITAVATPATTAKIFMPLAARLAP